MKGSDHFGSSNIVGRTFSPVEIFTAIALALVVLVGQGRPIFFRQARVGVGGRRFGILKLRTMTTEADPRDRRPTGLGKWLRQRGLDELPQLLNVLWGDMSLVGPRPHAVAHNVHYAQIIDGYLARHRVKPGITGWAQINGARGETDTPEKMQRRVDLDLYYIDRCSLLFDAKILIMTPYALFRGDAY